MLELALSVPQVPSRGSCPHRRERSCGRCCIRHHELLGDWNGYACRAGWTGCAGTPRSRRSRRSRPTATLPLCSRVAGN